MRYWYDCEFLEDGRTIDMISIGIVAEDGRELYLVNADAPWRRIRKSPWLMANVVPHLPKVHGDARNHMPRSWLFNMADPVVESQGNIADAVKHFMTGRNEGVELWGYYSSYDHVLLSQLYGRMIDHPRGMPMWTNDIQQEAVRLGLDGTLPAQDGTEHHALADARWNRKAWEYLRDHPLAASSA